MGPGLANEDGGIAVLGSDLRLTLVCQKLEAMDLKFPGGVWN